MAKAVPDITRIVNSSILQKLPDAVFQATGLATGIHNPGGELITTIGRADFCAFCRNMFFGREGHRRCVHSNTVGQRRAYEIGSPYIYHCHSSLVDVSAPIIVNGEHVGSVSCGQILVEPLTDAYRDRVRRRLVEFSDAFQRQQMSALEEVHVLPLSRVRGLAQLLSIIANNIVNLLVSNTNQREMQLQTERLLEEIKAHSLLENEIKQAQLALKEAELKALQAQINPHFLYNTLDSIQWLAVLQGADEIQKSIQCLCQLLRYSLDRKSVIVNVAKELEQNRNYLFIQKMRYGEKLSFQINVEPGVLEFEVPKLIFQPIVENAVLHGLEPKSANGNIRIEGWLHRPDQVIVEISDDGVGMEDDALSSLVTSLNSDDSGGSGKHMGLSNVQHRLQQYFGEAFGLTISSRKGAGSSVRVSIPRRTRKE